MKVKILDDLEGDIMSDDSCDREWKELEELYEKGEIFKIKLHKLFKEHRKLKNKKGLFKSEIEEYGNREKMINLEITISVYNKILNNNIKRVEEIRNDILKKQDMSKFCEKMNEIQKAIKVSIRKEYPFL